jgi:MFS-type transporter involved in bile tolerance (Atg22 family)
MEENKQMDNHLNTKKLNISILIGWCLFDFANSVPAVIGGIYFSKWFVLDIGGGTVLFNVLFFISALVIMISGKWMGRKIDLSGFKTWIRISSIMTFTSLLLIFLSSQFVSKNLIIYFAFLLFLLFLFSYQISKICHNVFLRNVIPNKIQTKMSGLGAAANWFGSIFGILLTIPIMNYFSGANAREITFLVATVAYGTLTPLSLFLMFRNIHMQNEEGKHLITRDYSWNEILKVTGKLLLIYLILFDVMAMVEKNLPSFLTQVKKMSDSLQAEGFLIILFSAMIGGIIAAKLVNYKNANYYLRLNSLTLALAIIFITFKSETIIWIAFIIAGISYGILESAIRIDFMSTFPPEKAGVNFGILASIERTSGTIGPLIWILPFLLNYNSDRSYIFSMWLMALLAISAFILLFFINPTRKSKIVNDY